MLLLLDLDDTIFETKSIKAETFRPVLEIVEDYYKVHFGMQKANEVLMDLWKFPFDVVADKHQMPTTLQDQVFQTLDSLEYKLEISTFPDYPVLEKIPIPKILVTTGFTNLQLAKIEALGIHSHFEAIFIDNPSARPRTNKSYIFQQILKSQDLSAQKIWVIGDNPNSEIKAGKELGMPTIQRLNGSRIKSDTADFGIQHFEEVASILGAFA